MWQKACDNPEVSIVILIILLMIGLLLLGGKHDD